MSGGYPTISLFHFLPAPFLSHWRKKKAQHKSAKKFYNVDANGPQQTEQTGTKRT